MKYILVNERRPNDFEPIYWSNNENLYMLSQIDELTSKYDESEFNEYLISNNLIESDNNNFQIIFNDGKLRKLKDGLLYKEDYNSNFLDYIKSFIKENMNNKNALNNLAQKVKSDVLISKYTKELLIVIISNIHLPYDELRFLLNKLESVTYLDLRIIYLYIKRVLEVKIDNNKTKVLNKKDSEI